MPQTQAQEASPAGSMPDALFFARQPVFDPGLNVHGYEFFYRSDDQASTATFEDEDEATRKVIQSALVTPFVNVGKDAFLIVNFSFQSLDNHSALALPPGNTIIKLSGSAEMNPGRVKTLQALKNEGYKLAMDGSMMDCASWKDYMDICIIDALDPQIKEIMKRSQAIKNAGLTLMAKRVEEQKQFNILKDSGFALFQGFFFQKPDQVKMKNISTHSVLRLKILQLLQKEEPELDKIADLLEKEVSLAYRILKFVNSAYFSTPVKINSVRHALSYIGLNNLKNLLELFLVKSITPENKPSELPFTSAHRGRFMQTLARDMPEYAKKADSLFLLGLLSLLDAIFDMPMENVLESLPLEDDIADALCRRNSPYLPWLRLAAAFEEAKWNDVDKYVSELGLSQADVARNYSLSLSWTRDFFNFDV